MIAVYLLNRITGQPGQAGQMMEEEIAGDTSALALLSWMYGIWKEVYLKVNISLPNFVWVHSIYILFIIFKYQFDLNIVLIA